MSADFAAGSIAGEREDVSMSVIVLNGTSSSGKTTLAATLQEQLADECWIVASNDDFLAKVPSLWLQYGKAHVGARAEQGLAFTFDAGRLVRQTGPVGWQIFEAWHGSVAAIARAGLNVIVDDVLLLESDWRGWQRHLDGLQVIWVQVDVALEIAEERERGRGDRAPGLARSQVRDVHQHVRYDITVDTGTMTPAQAAARIRALLTERVASAPNSPAATEPE